MSIPITKYVDITSSLTGTAAVSERELILRIFTTNPLFPVNTTLEFTSSAQVGEYAGTTSEEFNRSVPYFSWVSKLSTQAEKISFTGYSETGSSPAILGGIKSQSLTLLQSYTAAELTITMGAEIGVTAPIDLSVATSIADAMAIIETAIQASNVDPLFSSSTLIYDAVLQKVIFRGGSNQQADISVSSTTTGFLSELAWTIDTGVVFSNGTAGNTLTEILNISTLDNNNFASFLFQENLNTTQINEIAAWNDGQNNRYTYLLPVNSSTIDLSGLVTGLQNFSGTGITYTTTSTTDYSEQIPASIAAATRYQNQNSVANYMYQRNFNYPVSVNDETLSDTLDNLNINYYGQVQKSGQLEIFYQRGKMVGKTSSPQDMNVYYNEIWLKDSIETGIFNLLLSVNRISANPNGETLLANTIKVSIDQALLNGTISVNRTLTDLQKSEIKNISNDDTAVLQVQTLGYWLDVTIVINSSTNEFEAEYILIYAKDDVIRKVVGRNILI